MSRTYLLVTRRYVRRWSVQTVTIYRRYFNIVALFDMMAQTYISRTLSWARGPSPAVSEAAVTTSSGSLSINIDDMLANRICSFRTSQSQSQFLQIDHP